MRVIKEETEGYFMIRKQHTEAARKPPNGSSQRLNLRAINISEAAEKRHSTTWPRGEGSVYESCSH
jgi:hypothetical protein